MYICVVYCVLSSVLQAKIVAISKKGEYYTVLTLVLSVVESFIKW